MTTKRKPRTQNASPSGAAAATLPPEPPAEAGPAQSRDGAADMAGRGPGRPPGQPNRNYDRGERRPGQCRKCKSTEATTQKKTIRRLPQDPDYTHVELIRCRCRRCGQWRIDRQPINVD